MNEEEPPLPQWTPVGKRKPRTYYCYVTNKSINPYCFIAQYNRVSDQFILPHMVRQMNDEYLFNDNEVRIALCVTHFIELPEFWWAFEMKEPTKQDIERGDEAKKNLRNQYEKEGIPVPLGLQEYLS